MPDEAWRSERNKRALIANRPIQNADPSSHNLNHSQYNYLLLLQIAKKKKSLTNNPNLGTWQHLPEATLVPSCQL